MHKWLHGIHQGLKVCQPTLKAKGTQRWPVPSPTIDGVFVFGRGFVVFDNGPIQFVSDEDRAKEPNKCWVLRDTRRMPGETLLVLFLLLTKAISGSTGLVLRVGPYANALENGARLVD